MVEWLKRVWAVISYDERQEIIDRIRARGAHTVTIVPTLKVEVTATEGEVMRDNSVQAEIQRKMTIGFEGEGEDARTDAQRINGTFWDNMEAAGISFEDRVKVLESMSAALETHCGTLYIP